MRKITGLFALLIVCVGLARCVSVDNREKLLSTEWKLFGIDGLGDVQMDENSTAYINFSDSTTFAGNGGCNQFFGAFTADSEDVIEMNVKGRTMMMCPNINFEDVYIGGLSSIATYTIEDNKLSLKSDDGQVTLVYTAVE